LPLLTIIAPHRNAIDTIAISDAVAESEPFRSRQISTVSKRSMDDGA
jgi:hypothetical protein